MYSLTVSPQMGCSSTATVQDAIDSAFLAGGGEVVLSSGVYSVGGLRLRSGVTLRLSSGAILKGSLDPDDYLGFLDDKVEPFTEYDKTHVAPTALLGNSSRSATPLSRWNNAIIRAYKAENIAIIGEEGSVIDGGNCFDPVGEEYYRGPHAINMWYCKNIRLEGYRVENSANWAHAIQNSSDITLRGVTVLGGHDGFDARTCDNVLLEKCEFHTGDDCIAGFDNLNVTVRDCVFDGACSMARFGGTDVVFERCRGYAPTTYGFRGSLPTHLREASAPTTESNSRHNCLTVFLYYCDARAKVRRTPGNVVFRDCSFDFADTLMGHPYGHIWCCNRALSSVRFENCTVTNLSIPSLIYSPKGSPMSVELVGCTLSSRPKCSRLPLADLKGDITLTLSGCTLTGMHPEVATGESGGRVRIIEA